MGSGCVCWGIIGVTLGLHLRYIGLYWLILRLCWDNGKPEMEATI